MSDYRIVVDAVGGPEAMRAEPVDAAALVPGPGEVRVRHRAVGLNYIDTYQRSGLYPVPLPSGLGAEAAGVVEAIGDGVVDVSVGDRVAYGTGPLGAYATVRTMPAEHLVALPDDVSDEVAAASMLKGMTACYLIEQCARVEAGQTVLVHAAAGGMGSILVPWLAAIGATVIGHAGSADKADEARAAGATHALSCPMNELAREVRGLTDDRGVAVVLDGVGAASWDASLASLATRGLLVTYGNASGAVAPFTPLELMKAGSVFVTRPTLAHYGATADQRRHLAARVFEMRRNGVGVSIGQRFPLADAAAAHRALESRQTRGATIMTV